MVNREARLDRLFGALGNATRRRILARLEAGDDPSVSELAAPLGMKLPAMLKQLGVLENAKLIVREKVGRTIHVRLAARPMSEAMDWLRRYEHFWPKRLDRLATLAEDLERRTPKAR